MSKPDKNQGSIVMMESTEMAALKQALQNILERLKPLFQRETKIIWPDGKSRTYRIVEVLSRQRFWLIGTMERRRTLFSLNLNRLGEYLSGVDIYDQAILAIVEEELARFGATTGRNKMAMAKHWQE